MRILEPKRLAVLGAVVLGAGLLAACVPPPPPPPPPTMVDDDGQAAPGDCDAADTAASTIGAAVSAVASGTHIDVCPGTYAEQLTIPDTKDDITLTSVQSRAATIKAPPTMAEPGDIIRVNGATGWTISGFVISGPLPNALFCSVETRAGLFVAGSGEVTVDDNAFTDIWATDPSLRGCQNGIAIRVGRHAAPTHVGTATITNNDFGNYQKAAIVIDGTGSSADVGLNTVTGEGPVNYIAQNGIQVSRGAVGNVAGNVVTGHTYSLAPSSSSTGILLFQSGAGLIVNNNDVRQNDDNIALFDTDGITVQQNAVRNSTFFDGLFADSDTSGNQFIGNFADDNQLFDCEDLSIAVTVPPVANTWTDNIGTTSFPPGICTPPAGGGPTSQGSQSRARAAGHVPAPAG